MTTVLSCGVLVTDGRRLLIGHATSSARWDIPKGVADPGETSEAAARRELQEETGLRAPDASLASLGRYPYRPGKDLALFAWQIPAMPDPAALRCASTFLRAGRRLPEFDRFACAPWPEALPRLGKAMQLVLGPLARERTWL